jgi:uncharacterized RDD family membrane protein YckC
MLSETPAAIGTTRVSPLLGSAQIELAGLGRRLIAFALDGGLAAGSFVLFFAAAFRLLPVSSDDWWWIGFVIGYLSPLIVPVFVVFLLPLPFAAAGWIGGGETPGKIVVGAAIRDDDLDYGLPGFRRLYGREFSRAWRLLLVIPALVDHFGALTEPCRRTRHDLAAGTVVVRGRAPHALLRLLASLTAFVTMFFAVMAAVIGFAIAFLLT